MVQSYKEVKTLRVTIERENGTSVVEGPDAQRWSDAVDAMGTYLSAQNANPFDKIRLDWKTFPPVPPPPSIDSIPLKAEADVKPEEAAVAA